MIIFNGRSIKLSDILPSTDGGNTPEIIVTASEKIIVDIDLKLQDTHLVLLGPLIEIINPDTKIEAFGEDGKAHSPGKAQNARSKGEHGSHGLNGNGGFSSGSIRIYALDVVNPTFLNIFTRGGNGGDGQSGGNGRNASNNCRKPNMEDLSERNEIQISSDDPPTNGGNGGDAGPGALAGIIEIDISNQEAKQKVSITLSQGHNAAPGFGAKAGSNCSRGKVGKYVSYSSMDFYPGSFSNPGAILVSDMTEQYPSAVDGTAGSSTPESFQHQTYKYVNITPMAKLVFDFWKKILTEGMEICQTSITFLQHLLSTAEFTRTLSSKYYLNFLEESDHTISTATVSNLKIVFTEIRNAIERNRDNFTLPNEKFYFNLADMMLLSRLDLLEAFSQKRQTVDLYHTLETVIDDLSTAGISVEMSRRMELVEREKKSLVKEIQDGQDLIQKKFTAKLEQASNELENTFKELVKNAKGLATTYQNNSMELKRHHTNMSMVIGMKAFFELLNTTAQIAGIAWSSAASLGAKIIGTAIVPFKSEVDLSKFTPILPDAVSKSNELIQRIEENMYQRQNSVASVAREVLKADILHGRVISKKDREAITTKVKEPTERFTLLFKSDEVFDVLDNAITKMKETDSQSDVDRLNYLQDKLVIAKKVAGGFDGVKLLNETAKDKHVLSDISAAIRSNETAFNAINTYQDRLHKYLKPMLLEIVGLYESQSDAASRSNQFQLQFMKFDARCHVRKFESLIDEFTAGFAHAQGGLRQILCELRQFLTVVMDVYDKIHDTKHRLQLVDFLGGLHGFDDESRSALSRARAQIDTNDVVREFVLICSAYKQASFPFAGENSPILNKTLSSLKPNMAPVQKLQILELGLRRIKQELNDWRNKIVEARDNNLINCLFNSDCASSKPFYVWPNEYFEEDIESLLLGNQVTFISSVYAPGIRNAVKFRDISLNFKSRNVEVNRQLRKALDKCEVEMIHSGEHHFKCGHRMYVIGGERLVMKFSFERDSCGEFVSRNTIVDKLKLGDVAPSPYTVWKFKISPCVESFEMERELRSFASKVDLELVGSGYYVKEEADICRQDLSANYNLFEN